jgi:hypothetical protein
MWVVCVMQVPRFPRELWWMGAAFLGFKLLSGAVTRVHVLVSENRRRKQHLLEDWRTVRVRYSLAATANLCQYC